MRTETLLIGLGVGSALIAFWVAVRFPRRGPRDMQHALLHIAAAIAVGWFAGDAFGAIVGFGRAIAMGGLFVIVLPVLVYTFLSGAWFLKLAHAAMNQYRP